MSDPNVTVTKVDTQMRAIVAGGAAAAVGAVTWFLYKPNVKFDPNKPFDPETNPCFSGDSKVLMADGSEKLVADLKKGDVIKSGESTATVKCVVKTNTAGTAELVSLPNGMKITPWHPMKVNGQWTFPIQLKESDIEQCDAVYSFVLENSASSLIINGFECVSMGHNLTGAVVGHKYFGSEAVVDDLKEMNGWESGLVELQTGCVVRDASNMVCGLKQFNGISLKSGHIASTASTIKADELTIA